MNGFEVVHVHTNEQEREEKIYMYKWNKIGNAAIVCHPIEKLMLFNLQSRAEARQFELHLNIILSNCLIWRKITTSISINEHLPFFFSSFKKQFCQSHNLESSFSID